MDSRSYKDILTKSGQTYHTFVAPPKDASKPTIVFIHGLSCTALGLDNQFADAELQTNFHIVRYEMRGHGRSSKPLEETDYESKKIAEDFRTVCEAFGVVKPFMAGW